MAVSDCLLGKFFPSSATISFLYSAPNLVMSHNMEKEDGDTLQGVKDNEQPGKHISSDVIGSQQTKKPSDPKEWQETDKGFERIHY